MGELAPIERTNNPPGLWMKQKRSEEEVPVDRDGRAKMATGDIWSWALAGLIGAGRLWPSRPRDG
jgi:hypothetical protein